MKLSDTSQPSLTRRNLLLGGGAFSLLAATGCTPSSSDGATNEAGTLRFAWWGGTERQNLYTEFVQTFQDANPDLTLSLEPADYNAYVDRLAVQAAARNLPDTFWVPGSQFLTYASQDSMLDLDEVPDGTIDYSDFDTDQVDSWRALGGKLYSAVYNQINPVIQVNQGHFDELGIEVPDDETWDWDDLRAIAMEYSEATDEGIYGIRYGAASQQHIEQWLRQQGAELFDEDGNMGFDATILGDWFDMWEQWTADGAVLPVQAAGSITAPYPEIAGNIGIETGQANHLFDNQAASDGELAMYLLPAGPEAAEGFPYLWYNRICVAANTADPEVAGKFINFFINDEASVDAIGVISGPPSNPRLRDLAREKATEADDQESLKVIDIVQRESEREMRPRAEAPAGASGWNSLLARTAENIAVGGVPIAEASESMIADLQRSLDGA